MRKCQDDYFISSKMSRYYLFLFSIFSPWLQMVHKSWLEKIRFHFSYGGDISNLLLASQLFQLTKLIILGGKSWVVGYLYQGQAFFHLQALRLSNIDWSCLESNHCRGTIWCNGCDTNLFCLGFDWEILPPLTVVFLLNPQRKQGRQIQIALTYSATNIGIF